MRLTRLGLIGIAVRDWFSRAAEEPEPEPVYALPITANVVISVGAAAVALAAGAVALTIETGAAAVTTRVSG